MRKEQEIRIALEAGFEVQQIDVVNESDLHAGHAGHDGTGESHFRVRIRAPEFAEMSRLARHRAVHGALGADLVASIHALALDIDG